MNHKETLHSGREFVCKERVHAANLGAPNFGLRELFGGVHLGIYWGRIKNYHGDKKKELAPTK